MVRSGHFFPSASHCLHLSLVNLEVIWQVMDSLINLRP